MVSPYRDKVLTFLLVFRPVLLLSARLNGTSCVMYKGRAGLSLCSNSSASFNQLTFFTLVIHYVVYLFDRASSRDTHFGCAKHEA